MTRIRPLSAKAQNFLKYEMDNNPSIRIELRRGSKVFFVSKNGKYCSWANLASDPHWEIILN